jgi:REP element-mobilizing transposase RayT
MDKFQDRYRISSHRLRGWDYSSNGYYFITIVTQNRDCILGRIENHQMILSDFGTIVNVEWYESFNIRTELFLDEFVIMPNHLHALIVLKKQVFVVKSSGLDLNVETHGLDLNVETHGRASLPTESTEPIQSPQKMPERKPKSISSFIAGFKSATITKIDDYIDFYNLAISKYNRENKLWQANYHDHIVRNEEEYWKIKNYIRNNPKNWKDDKFFE